MLSAMAVSHGTQMTIAAVTQAIKPERGNGAAAVVAAALVLPGTAEPRDGVPSAGPPPAMVANARGWRGGGLGQRRQREEGVKGGEGKERGGGGSMKTASGTYCGSTVTKVA